METWDPSMCASLDRKRAVEYPGAAPAEEEDAMRLVTCQGRPFRPAATEGEAYLVDATVSLSVPLSLCPSVPLSLCPSPRPRVL